MKDMATKKPLPKGKIELVEIDPAEYASGMQVFLPYSHTMVHGVGFIKTSDRDNEEWMFSCDNGTAYLNGKLGGDPARKFYRLLVTFEVDGNQITKYLNTAQWDYAYNNGLIDGEKFDVHDNDSQVVEVSAFGRLYSREEVKKFIKQYHTDFILHTTLNKPYIRDITEWFNHKALKS